MIFVRIAPSDSSSSRSHTATAAPIVESADDPVYPVATYIPWTLAEGTGLLQDVVPHPYGIHGVLEDQGYPMARLHDSAIARMPTLAEKGALRLPAGVPVTDLLHVSVRADDTPYEATRFVMRGDMSSVSYDAPIE